MDIGQAFTYVSQDPKWTTKLLIGGGLLFATFLAIFTIVGWIPLLLIVIGYLVFLVRNVIEGREYPLPEWDNWGELLKEGAKAFAVSLILSLPVIVVSLLIAIPATVLQASDSTDTRNLGSTISLLGNCLTFPLGIILGLISPIAIARYATTRSIGQALQLGAIFATLRANIGTYVIVLLLGYLMAFIGGLGFIACGIGVFFTAFYSQLVNYHLYGQAYRKATGMAPGAAYGQQPSARPF